MNQAMLGLRLVTRMATALVIVPSDSLHSELVEPRADGMESHHVAGHFFARARQPGGH